MKRIYIFGTIIVFVVVVVALLGTMFFLLQQTPSVSGEELMGTKTYFTGDKILEYRTDEWATHRYFFHGFTSDYELVIGHYVARVEVGVMSNIYFPEYTGNWILYLGDNHSYKVITYDRMGMLRLEKIR